MTSAQIAKSHGFRTEVRIHVLAQDFGKPNLQNDANPQSQTVTPSLMALYATTPSASACSFLVHSSLPAGLSVHYGAPTDVWLSVSANSSGVSLSLSWFNKTTTRLPEAIWLQFNPLNSIEAHWSMDKLGEWIGSNEVS